MIGVAEGSDGVSLPPSIVCLCSVALEGRLVLLKEGR